MKYLNQNHLDYLLTDACIKGDIASVNIFLQDGANVHWCDEHPLRMAISYHHLNCIQSLMNYGATVQTRNHNLFTLATSSGNTDIVKYFIDYGVDTHYNDDEAFKESLNNSNIEIVLLFINNGHNINLAFKKANATIKNGLKQYINSKELFDKLDTDLIQKISTKSLKI